MVENSSRGMECGGTTPLWLHLPSDQRAGIHSPSSQSGNMFPQSTSLSALPASLCGASVRLKPLVLLRRNRRENRRHPIEARKTSPHTSFDGESVPFSSPSKPFDRLYSSFDALYSSFDGPSEVFDGVFPPFHPLTVLLLETVVRFRTQKRFRQWPQGGDRRKQARRAE